MAGKETSSSGPHGNTDALYRTLSATRGVLLGMGVDIVEVMVSHVSVAQTVNKKVTSDPGQVPERRQSKIISLVQALCDKLYKHGYVLEAIDFRDTAEQNLKNTDWSMRVYIKNKTITSATN